MPIEIFYGRTRNMVNRPGREEEYGYLLVRSPFDDPRRIDSVTFVKKESFNLMMKDGIALRMKIKKELKK